MPTLKEVHSFLSTLFEMGQLSAECSIVCLIYVERLMEMANVPLLATTWRSVLLCGMLLASKVWQDLSSWNVEFSQIVPQYSLASINRLERTSVRRSNGTCTSPAAPTPSTTLPSGPCLKRRTFGKSTPWDSSKPQMLTRWPRGPKGSSRACSPACSVNLCDRNG